MRRDLGRDGVQPDPLAHVAGEAGMSTDLRRQFVSQPPWRGTRGDDYGRASHLFIVLPDGMPPHEEAARRYVVADRGSS